MAGQTNKPEKFILLVEDSVRIRQLVTAILCNPSWHVVEAETGEQALELETGHYSIDLLITDLVLPGMSGLELADQIRARYPAVKVLCISGHMLPSMPRDGIHFIEKPFHPNVLLSKAQELLD